MRAGLQSRCGPHTAPTGESTAGSRHSASVRHGHRLDPIDLMDLLLTLSDSVGCGRNVERLSLSLVTAHAPAARGSHAPRRALQAPRIRRGSSRPDARRPRPWVDCGGSIATNEEVRRDRGNSWTGARIRINPIMPNQAPETSVLCSVWIVAGFGRSRWPWTDVVAADWVATPPSPKMSKRGGCQLAASPPPIPFALSVPSGRPPNCAPNVDLMDLLTAGERNRGIAKQCEGQ